MASLRNEAAKHPEIADLIIVDGQGDITKQVNDIQDLISQQVDAIRASRTRRRRSPRCSRGRDARQYTGYPLQSGCFG